MRKNYPAFFGKVALLFTFWLTNLHSLQAQTDINIGTGTSGNSTTGYPCPLQDRYEGSRMQYLYKASELNTAGMGPGLITHIKYNIISLGTAGEIEDLVVKIGHTTATSLATSSWDSFTGTTSETTSTDYIPVGGINTIVLPVPFFWNGVDNILIEICNGEPGNDVGTWYTVNPVIPWTTGLSFNGSHTFRIDNDGNSCGIATTTNTGTQTTRPNITFSWTPAAACSGTPVGGTTTSSQTSVCNTITQLQLSVSGATVATGLTYQWQSSPDGVAWTDIPGATSFSYTSPGITATTYFRRQITCSGNSSFATAVQVIMSPPAYIPLPYSQGFETAWMDACGVKDVPDNSWRNTPFTGNNSWRRNDEGSLAGWTTATGGAYAPTASVGNYSARFHSDQATNGLKGQFDLHINANTATGNKRLTFDYINTSGSDSLVIRLSTDGGANFIRLDSLRTATTWKKRTIYFNSLSATTIIRFEATSDNGTTDYGLDNITVLDWLDCTGTPNGGTTATSANSVCVGETFQLTVTGITEANGMTYQWQQSADNINWTNIPGATNLFYNTTQLTTTYYRIVATCGLNATSGNSTSIQVVSPLLAGGIYTINNSLPTGAGNFNTFNDAYDFIKCGITSPVVFNVAAGTGPYNEQLIMSPVPGTSATNTITFKGDGFATIKFASIVSIQRAVIKLVGTKHIIFDNLIINASEGDYGYGVQLMSNTDSNTVRNCTILLDSLYNTQNFAGIVVNGSNEGPVATGTVLSDYNTFANNTINGGFYGITLVGTYPAGANGFNTISGNHVKNFYQYGIYIAGSFNTTIDSNYISRPTRNNVGEFQGIYFNTGSLLAKVSKNRIFNPFGGNTGSTANFYGINFNNAAGAAGSVNIISNNLIYDVNGNGPVYGIANTGSGFAQYYHNTISLDNTGSTSSGLTRGFHQATLASGIFFFDNIISITRGGTGPKHGIYLGTSLIAGVDYNDYYISAAGGINSVGFYTSDHGSLSEWKAATGFDASSFSAIPSFTDPANGNFAPGNAAINDKGVFVDITHDINNILRNSPPDIGAYEFTPPPCSIPPVNGLVSIFPDTTCENTPVQLSLQIGAFGSGQTFQWESSSNATGPFLPLGNPMISADTIISAVTTLYYRVAISCGASTVYSDTLKLVVIPALPSGTYTINQTLGTTYIPGVPGGNFNSFAAAKIAMGCGITGGPIVFNVVANTGPYIEQLVLDSIPGVTAINNITFNGNGDTLRFNSIDANERAVLKLDGADHIIFDSLVIDARTAGFGFGVQLIRDADSNTIRKSTILSSTENTTTDFAGIVINAADNNAIATGVTMCDGNLFESNRIIGGYYGVTLVGNTTTPGFVSNNKFINNEVLDFYSYGFYLRGTNNTVIDGNTISRPGRTNTDANVHGIYLVTNPSEGLVVNANRFTNFFGGLPESTSNLYVIRHNGIDAGSTNIVSNNLVYKLGGNGAQYALHNTGSNGISYLHNTISLDEVSSTTAAVTVGFYQSTLANTIQFHNNLITISRGGTGNKHAVHHNTSTSTIVSNFNNLYVKGTNAYVGFYTANRASLADWQAASGDDLNSLDLNPLYTDSASGNYKPQLGSLDNKGTPANITTDISKLARSATTPDIGAYEFAPPACQNPPVPGTASVTPNTGLCLEMPVTLDVTGHSPLGSITFQWQTSPDGTNWTNIGPLQYFPTYDTIATLSTYYRAAVTCNGVTNYTDTVQVTLNNILLQGTYSINPAQPTGGTNFQSFQAAVDALLCGISGPILFNVSPGTYNEQIRIPYIPNTSAVNTVTFQSLHRVADSVHLSFAGTVTDNYTLKLDSVRHFIFKDLTFEGSNTTYGRVIELTNSASYDSIINTVIVVPAALSATNNIAGIYADDFKGKDIVIKGNTINGGSYGIYFGGVSAASLATKNHLIEGNTITGAYADGINVQFVNSIRIRDNRVNLNGDAGSNAAGIHTIYADTASRITGNIVRIANVAADPVYGYRIENSRALMTDSVIVASNRVLAGSGNTGSIYGMTISASRGVSVVNNVIAINSAGANAYGLYNLNNNGDINYYNNTVNLLAASSGGYAGYFTQTATAIMQVKNNIFANPGGGRALFVNDPVLFSADYNMLHSSGANLVEVATGAVLTFPDLLSWKNTWNWDKSSISYAPAFLNDQDLRPDLNNPNVWAMHGRGVQVRGNTWDFDNNNRPDELTEGVPDMGAYEFYPVALPTALLATPAAPAPNTTQIFSYGTDTVMKISWAAVAPASVEVQRFSGVVPTGLLPGTDSMFFYTKVNIPGGANYNYAAKLYYIDSWQGSIPQQNRLGLGRTTASNAWVVGANSRVDVGKKEISQEGMLFLDRFTGLLNPFAQPESEDSNSNRGKDFWVGYQRTNGFTGANGGGQTMVLYFGASDIPANVTVTIEGTSGTPWVRNYFVPANSAVTSDVIPKTGADDARLFTEGLYDKRGIHITSDVPIVAYAHIYESANSGATMLMPTAVWGYEYYTLSSRQSYSTTGSASVFHIIAQQDSTWIEINPSKPTISGWVPNGGTRPNGSYLVKLNKGDAYQLLGAVLSGSEGHDLTGSYVKSVSNAQGQCHPIAVFAGSTRTAIGCGATAPTTNGDLILQQIFPYQAWGNKYATAPTSIESGPNATSNKTEVYRIMVRDPATQVTLNGTPLLQSDLVNNRYYQFVSNVANYIESNQPILVAQFMSSSSVSTSDCPNTNGDGDPEMFYLSPIQQAIKKTQFYRNDETSIDENFITIIIPTEGLASLKIDGISYQAYPTGLRYVYDHPNLPGYSVVTKKWATGAGSSTVESEFAFTGIVYGIGSVESYGYNVGTLVKNLNNLSTVNTVFNTGANPTEYTCKGAPFKLAAYLPLIPTSIQWQFSQVPRLSPAVDSIQQNPVPYETVVINGIEYYAFTLNANFVLDTAGIITIPIKYTSPFIERCDQTEPGAVIVQVLPSPVTDFTITPGDEGCPGQTFTFTGDVITQNGIALNQWNWTFGPGNTTASGQVQTFTYPAAGVFTVKLSGLTADGCISDTTRQILINPNPDVNLVQDNVLICPNSNAVLAVQNPVSGTTYNWYNVPTGGTILGTGSTYTATNVIPPASFYVEAITSAGCVSASRRQATVSTVGALPGPVITADSIAVDLIRFAWNPVAGATGYEVSVNGGATWTNPSSGSAGLTHTVAGLLPGREASLLVRTTGGCVNGTSLAFTARTLLDQVYIPNAFTPNGDGLNDTWRVYANVVDKIQMMIFNQWGEKIFESTNLATGWDGTHNGKAQPSGVYMYVCKMVLLDGSELVRKGAINLVR